MNDEPSKVRVITRPKATRIMIANGKGGVGKTTVSTNLITHLSEQGPVGLMDLDPQRSASFWLQLRGERKPIVTSYSTKEFERSRVTRSWLNHKLSEQVKYVVCDTPAGLQSPELDRLLVETDILLIPVAPSQIDIHATAAFVKQLLLNPQYRSRPVRLGVIMNRVKRNTLSFQKLVRFLQNLKIPVIAALRDTQIYLKAVEAGMGINELGQRMDSDKNEWEKVIRWVQRAQQQQAELMERRKTQANLEEGTHELLGSASEPIKN